MYLRGGKYSIAECGEQLRQSPSVALPEQHCGEPGARAWILVPEDGQPRPFVVGTAALFAYWIPPRGRWWFLCARIWSWPFLRAAGIRVETEGPEIDPPFVYVANHESLLDIPVLLTRLPRSARFLAKKVLFYLPWVGWNMWMAGFVPIDRARRRRARRASRTAASTPAGAGAAPAGQGGWTDW